MTFCYRAFGLSIFSEIELFGLKPMAPDAACSSESPNISVGIGAVPEHLDVISAARAHVQVGPQRVLITCRNVAKFLIKEGASITIDPAGGASLHQVSPYVTGSCFGALLQQRKKITFHGGAVKKKNSGAIVFLGHRGSGKSTLTAMLGNEGYDILTDDLCAVDPTDQSCGLLPGIPSIKLCGGALQTLKHDFSGLRTIQTHREKYLIAVNPLKDLSRLDIERVYFLAWGDCINIDSVPKPQAIVLLRKNAFRKWMIKHTLGEPVIFETCSRMVQSSPVFIFTRPQNFQKAKEALDYLTKHLEM